MAAFFPLENSLLSKSVIFCENISTSKEYNVKWHSWSKQTVTNSTWFKYVKLSGNSRMGKQLLRADDVQDYNPGKKILHPLNCDFPVKKTTKETGGLVFLVKEYMSAKETSLNQIRGWILKDCICLLSELRKHRSACFLVQLLLLCKQFPAW